MKYQTEYEKGTFFQPTLLQLNLHKEKGKKTPAQQMPWQKKN